MSFEILPFVLGMCLVIRHSGSLRTNGVVLVMIGIIAATLSGEVLLPIPQAMFAVLQDAGIAIAGYVVARIVARYVSTETERVSEAQ